MILEFLGNKTGQAGQSVQGRTTADPGRIDRLGYEAGQGHVWKNQDVFQDRFRATPGHGC